MLSTLAGAELMLDITVRNPTVEVIQLNRILLEFPKGGIGPHALTPISNTYTVLIDPVLKRPIVRPQPNSPDSYPAEAWFSRGCGGAFKVLSPLWQTIDSNKVDRFILKTVFPNDKCLARAHLDTVQVIIFYSGAESEEEMKSPLVKIAGEQY
jgi:hypothetical protein